MSNKNRLIPFKFMPGSWGLSGRVFKEAEAAYNFDGIDLDYRLAEIRFENDPDILAREKLIIARNHKKLTSAEYDFELLKLEGRDKDPRALLAYKRSHQQINDYEFDTELAKLDHKIGEKLDRALLDVELNHERISQYDYDKSIVAFEHSDHESKEHRLGLLAVDFAHAKLTALQYEKECATVREEPWIRVIDDGFDPDKGVNGVYFEFDWNEFWIAFLRLNGYMGISDDQVIDAWFTDVCRSTLGPVQFTDEFGSDTFVARNPSR